MKASMERKASRSTKNLCMLVCFSWMCSSGVFVNGSYHGMKITMKMISHHLGKYVLIFVHYHLSKQNPDFVVFFFFPDYPPEV